jgi:hypothetical protein
MQFKYLIIGWTDQAPTLKVHKIENFFDSDFGICVISLIVRSKYSDFTKKFF